MTTPKRRSLLSFIFTCLIQFAFSFQCSWLFSEVYSVGSCYSVHCGLPYSYSFLCSLFVGRGVLISILFLETKRLSHSIGCYCSKRYICVFKYPSRPMKYSFKIVWVAAHSRLWPMANQIVCYLPRFLSHQSNRSFYLFNQSNSPCSLLRPIRSVLVYSSTNGIALFNHKDASFRRQSYNPNRTFSSNFARSCLLLKKWTPMMISSLV